MDNPKCGNVVEDHDSGEDSDATHASMPDLVPVSPPESSLSSVESRHASASEVSRLPKSAPGDRGSEGKGGLAALRRLGLPLSPFTHGLDGVKDDNMAGAVGSHKEASCQELLSPGADAPSHEAATVFRLSVVGGANFGKRYDALAGALDKLEGPCAGPLKTDLAAMSPAVGGGVQKCDIDDLCIEFSAAAERRLKRDRDEIDISLEEDGDESSGEDLDGEPSAKRRKRSDSDRISSEVPPGAPAVAPAALAVAAAAATFPLESCGATAKGRGTKRPDKNHSDMKSPVSSDSFGPRFRSLSGAELEKARSKWTLHSLADVQATSSDDNRRAAAMLLEDLRKRRTSSNGSDDKAADDIGSGSAGLPCKPTFRRPVTSGSTKSGSKVNSGGAAVEGSSSLASGGRLMAPCVAGAAPRKSAVTRSAISCAAAAGDELEDAAPLKRNAGSSGRAARAARRVSCAASLEEGDDVI